MTLAAFLVGLGCGVVLTVAAIWIALVHAVGLRW